MQNSDVSSLPCYALINYGHQLKTWPDWLHKELEVYAVPNGLLGQASAAGGVPNRLTPILRNVDELTNAGRFTFRRVTRVGQ